LGSLNTAWSNLDIRRRIIAITASVAVFGAVLMMARTTASSDVSLLYAGLDTATAGDVLTALDQRGVAYDVNGGAIFVPTAQRDKLRMELASEGLPANSSQGYELLDNLSGFGTTSQMFDAAYWRAKEGELARTMLASPYIRAVNVTTVNGSLETGQADALRFLVASAVPGLSANDVAVIDNVGGLMAGADDGAMPADTQERVFELRSRVERLLAARVGAGNSVVEVSVDTVTDTESFMERSFDPDTRVAISTEVQESTTSSQDSINGDVTIASNLPEGDAAGGAGAASSENSESRTITNYEVSETQREVLRAPGAISRISVAVLVNDVTTLDADGQPVTTPRPAEELEDLRMLIASAVGFDDGRGDEITIRSMAFEALPDAGTAAGEVTIPAVPLNMMKLIQTGVLALVALILGLFVVRPILTSNKSTPPLLDNSGGSAAADVSDFGGPLIDGLASPAVVDLPTNAADVSSTVDDPVERLRGLIDDRRDEAIQVLQSWIDEPDGTEPAK